jgi:DNA-directed RNA polymerase specialized sigma24 family protein
MVWLNGHVGALKKLTGEGRGSDIPLVIMGGDARRDAILSDAGILDSIRAVIRKRGIAESDVDDILHDVIEAACGDGSLPLDNKEHARLYLCGCARFKSIDQARARRKQRQRQGEGDVDAFESVDLPANQRALAHKLDAQGKKAFPFTYPWFQRFVVAGETHAEIAADPRVTAGHVRNEVANIRHALRAYALAGVVVGLFALGLWNLPGGAPQGKPVARSVPSGAPVPTDAAALRARAVGECNQGHVVDCMDDLEQALKLDPDGESPAIRELREHFEPHVETHFTEGKNGRP